MKIQDLINCAARELKMRESVYPRWVAQGKMSHAKADDEIACMRAILENLKDQAPERECEGQTNLFGGGM